MTTKTELPNTIIVMFFKAFNNFGEEKQVVLEVDSAPDMLRKFGFFIHGNYKGLLKGSVYRDMKGLDDMKLQFQGIRIHSSDYDANEAVTNLFGSNTSTDVTMRKSKSEVKYMQLVNSMQEVLDDIYE